MPYEMSWYVDERIVYEKFVGHVTVDEIRDLLHSGEELQKKAGDRTLYYIADITDLYSLPLNIVQLRKIELTPPARKGMTVVVSSPNYSVNSVATFFGKLMWTVFGLRFKILPDIEQAFAYLQEVDPSLRGLQLTKLGPTDTQPVRPGPTDTQPVSGSETTDTQPLKPVPQEKPTPKD